MKLFILLAFAILSISTPLRAQYYSNNDAFRNGYSRGLVAKGEIKIMNKTYDEAYDAFREAYNEYNSKDAAAWLGVMYELGMYVETDKSKAKSYYEWASQSNSMALAALQRIRTSGYWEATEESRNSFVNRLIALRQAQYANTNPGLGGSSFGNSGSGSYGSSSNTCPSCNGSGSCKGCSGVGKYWEEVGQYTGESYKKKVTCPVCYGTGKCGTCRGKGRI